MHKLKGSASTCCMRKTYEIATSLEENTDFNIIIFKNKLNELYEEIKLLKAIIKENLT